MLTFPYAIQINRQFQDLTRKSPELQYRRDLLPASLIENPHVPCGFVHRRRLCEEYERKWPDAGEGNEDGSRVARGTTFDMEFHHDYQREPRSFIQQAGQWFQFPTCSASQ